VSRFLPACFVALTIYKYCAETTLATKSRVDRTFLWLLGLWTGALENYTFDKLPIRRFTPRDIIDQPGAVLALVCIVGIIVLAALLQARSFWIEGRFLRYLTLYLAIGASLIVLAFVPGMNLRIHHYILALLLLPGTAMQTRTSMLFQGLLIGLFINGVARWGFASLLETDLWLAGKGPIGSPFPELTTPLVSGLDITFTWAEKLAKSWDGVSILVNDVERHRWFTGQGPSTFSWSRSKEQDLYFRFGLIRAGFVDGFLQGDYTSPSVWYKNGTWSGPI